MTIWKKEKQQWKSTEGLEKATKKENFFATHRWNVDLDMTKMVELILSSPSRASLVGIFSLYYIIILFSFELRRTKFVSHGAVIGVALKISSKLLGSAVLTQIHRPYCQGSNCSTGICRPRCNPKLQRKRPKRWWKIQWRRRRVGWYSTSSLRHSRLFRWWCRRLFGCHRPTGTETVGHTRGCTGSRGKFRFWHYFFHKRD